MPRILIFGNSGSGKSTLAKELANIFQVSHLDLDSFAWQDCDPPQRRPLQQSKAAIQQFTKQNDDWIIEGCYADLMSLVSTIGQQIIFLNPTTEQCIQNCRSRPWEPHKYESKQAQDANLELLLTWIKDYTKREDEFSLSAHQSLYDNFAGAKQRLTSNDQIDQFLLQTTKNY